VLNFRREWGEVVLRDRNHPSIVAWTPFNETEWAARERPAVHRRALEDTVRLTRALDSTRPVNDSSGYVHACRDTDIYTVHDYEQDPEAFRSHYAELGPEKREGYHVNLPELSVPYAGQAFVVDEYGGTWWAEDREEKGEGVGSDQTVSWGYGNAPRSKEEVYLRIEGLTKVLTDHPHIAGFCYTQLTDVEQEQNGLYTYDRRLKFDAARLRALFGAPSANESPGTSSNTRQ
jgi:beta-glucuronidase